MGDVCTELTNKTLNEKLETIERYFDADCISYYGQINQDSPFILSKIVSDLALENKHKHLVFLLTTSGGSILAVERIVQILRHYYEKITFIVPDYAYSAGTILCMSGDEIYMNYFSVLGPIDPQIQIRDGRWVSVSGYLDIIDELIEKSKNKEISPAEYTMLINIDLGEWDEFRRAEKHSIETLKNFLIQYKFKNWTQREESGKLVTAEYRKKRAEQIATRLSSTDWNSHGKPIHLKTLEEIGLKIKDYSNDFHFMQIVNDYYYLFEDVVSNINISPQLYVHTRRILL